MDSVTDREVRNYGNGSLTVNGDSDPPTSMDATIHTALHRDDSSAHADDDSSVRGLAPSDAGVADESHTSTSPVTSPASVTSPPYWSHGASGSHQRSTSNVSTESVLPVGGITMRDNEVSDNDERNKACWAKNVQITDYVVVNGSATNIGAFVVWTVRVETLQGGFMNIRKRYSEFDDLRQSLLMTFPDFKAAVPPLPPKSVVSKFRPKFLEKRRQGLQYFLHCIMLNPEFSGSPVLKEFLFS